MSPLQVTFSLVCVVLVIIGAYYATYYIGVKASGQSRGRHWNKNINVIDRFAISRDKSFCLVEIAGKVYIIGVTNQSMTVLDTLDAAAFAEAAAERRDAVIQTSESGGRLRNRLTNRLAVFMAERMGKSPSAGSRPGGGSFADSMKIARGKNEPGKHDRASTDRPDDPEDE